MKELMKFALAALAGMAAFALPSSASAAELLKSLPATRDPAMAYVLVELRNHDDAKLPGNIILARYDPVGGDVRGGLRSPASKLAKGASVRVSVRSKPLVKTEGGRLYLLALEPDTWVIEGAGGTAFSLGSKSFVARAGEVVDLGVLTPRGDYPEGEGPYRLTAGKVAKIALLGPFAKQPKPVPAMVEMRSREASDMAIPVSLRAAAKPASFQEGAKFGNYLGVVVNRIGGRKGRPGAQVKGAAATP